MSQTVGESAENGSAAGAKSAGGWKGWLFGLLVLILLSVVGILVFPQPRVPQGALTGRSHADGKSETEGSVSSAPFAELKAVSLQASTSTSSSLGSSRTREAVLADESIVIWNRSDHLLMKRVGLALFEALHGSRRFRNVRYLSSGETLPAGERLPDLSATLDLKSLVERGVMPSQRFDVRVLVTLGSDLAQSNRHYTDNLSPPVVSFSWNGEIHSEGTLTGFESSGARYSTLAAEVTKHLVESLGKTIDGLRKKESQTRPEAGPLRPPYLPPPQFDFLDQLSAEKVIDGNSLLCPTRAMWRFSSHLSAVEIQELVAADLTANDWSAPESATDDALWFRAVRGPETLEIFADQSTGDDMSVPHAAAASRTYWVAYTRRMTQEQIDAALSKWLDDAPPESSLIPFSRHWYRQQQLFETYFEQHPPSNAVTLHTLAEWRLNTGRKDEARDYLLRARALRQIFDLPEDEAAFKKLAERAELEPVPAVPDLETVDRLGLPDLRQPATVTTILSDERTVVALIAAGPQTQRYLILRMVPNSDGGWSLRQIVREFGNGGQRSSSLTEGGWDQSREVSRILGLGDDVHVELRSRPLEKAGEFEVTLTRQ